MQSPKTSLNLLLPHVILSTSTIKYPDRVGDLGIVLHEFPVRLSRVLKQRIRQQMHSFLEGRVRINLLGCEVGRKRENIYLGT